MNELLNELERRYREEWTGFFPSRCRDFIASVACPENAKDLLVRLLCVDLELSRATPESSPVGQLDEDEIRVSPCVELLRVQFPQLNEHPMGLERLIVLEFALRMQYDEHPPNIDSYIANCPSPRLLRNLEEAQARLHEIRYASAAALPTSLQVSKSRTTVPQSSNLSSLVAPRVPFTLGQFLLISYIGRGGMGFVYGAIDLRSTAKVAVKMMRRGDGWSVFRFIEEFRWLSQLNHPNLVRLYAAYAEGEARYFSMEYVQGKNIRDWYSEISKGSTDPTSQLTKSLGQLASAIHFLHTQDVIHRDIKYSNVLITPRGRTVLLDLGLAIRRTDPTFIEVPSSGESMPGTLSYMPPEAHNKQPLTSASDWYSFGVTVYELLTGELPNTKIDTQECGLRSFELDLKRAKSKLELAPAQLADLCLSLLETDPNRRPKGHAILSALEFHVENQGYSELSLNCIGRERELAVLADVRKNCLSMATTRQLVLLSGEPGVGKTTLLQNWLTNCRSNDCFVLSIQNYRQDNTPHRLMNTIVQELVRQWGANTQLLGEVFQPFAQEIGHSFPQFEQLTLASDAASTHSRKTPKELADWSIQRLLAAIAKLSQIKPVIIAVDDVQWADSHGLTYLCNSLQLKYNFRGIVILASDSFGQRSIETAIGDLDSVVRLTLKPLSPDECEVLLLDWMEQSDRRLSQAVLKRLVLLSKGSPFLLHELYRSFLDQQIVNGDSFVVGRSEGKHVSWRFSRIPWPAEVVLQYLAISDCPLMLQQLLSATRQTPLELQSCLNLLSQQGWIRILNETVDTVVQLASESFRDAILDTMAMDRLQRRNFRLARMLSVEIDPLWSRAAIHYERASEYRLAAACNIQAAQDAFRSGAFGDALRFIEKGLHRDADRSEVEQRKVLLMQANCLASLGESRKAFQLFKDLAEEGDQAQQAEFRVLAAIQLFRTGALSEGMEFVTRTLQQSQIVTGSRTYVRLRNSLAAWKAASRSIPALDVNANEGEYSESEHPLDEAYSCLIAPLWFLDPDRAFTVVARLSTLVEDSTYCVAFRCNAMLWTIILLKQFGQRYNEVAFLRLKLGIRVVRRLKAREAQRCYSSLALACMSLGKFRNASRYVRRAIEAVGPNQSWEQHFLLWNERSLWWFSGQLRRLVNSADQDRTTDRTMECPAFDFMANALPSVLAALVKGNVSDARNSIARAERFVETEQLLQPAGYVWLSKVALDLYRYDIETSAQTIDKELRQAIQSGLVNIMSFAVWAYTLRINLAMLRLRDDPDSRVLTKDRNFGIAQMKQVESLPLRSLADAYELQVDAGNGRRLESARWRKVRDRLSQNGLGLYAMALQWHESRYAETSFTSGDQQPHKSFELLGCKSPSQLMNLILPLPIKHA